MSVCISYWRLFAIVSLHVYDYTDNSNQRVYIHLIHTIKVASINNNAKKVEVFNMKVLTKHVISDIINRKQRQVIHNEKKL